MHPEQWELDTVVSTEQSNVKSNGKMGLQSAANDLHAWSMYRQNLNSDFTDSALGSDERLPYGNFQLREQTVQSILRHPRLAPRSELGSNMCAYLKFGLPRVFPPAMNSKDSSQVQNAQHQGPGHREGEREVIRSSRSELDLSNGLIANRFRRKHASGSATGGATGALRGAHSESNLLADDSKRRTNHQRSASQMSLVSKTQTAVSSPSRGHNFYGPEQDFNEEAILYDHPHLQIRGLTVQKGKGKSGHRVLDGVSIDVRGGEMLAILDTSMDEGTILLDTLAGRLSNHKMISGEFLLNGNPVTSTRLASRVAYVRRNYNLHPDLNVMQVLKYYSRLYNTLDTVKIPRVLEDLGLYTVATNSIDNLTPGEKTRLCVAIQILTEAEMLILDQPTHEMDIFDTFFLVDYLRTLCTSKAKIVLITIHPPTYEIFSMFNKIALISTGRLMFYGDRKEMLPYFAFIEYPCPGFKNPSDYYIDLVTLDDLSSEALLESSQRIETLADSFKRKQEPLRSPGPPGSLPRKIYSPGLFTQLYSILVYYVVYQFPMNLLTWVGKMLCVLSVSIVVGAVYWNIRLSPVQDQNSSTDRLAFIWTMMIVTPWVLIYLMSDTVRNESFERDFNEGIISKASYMIAKTTIDIPSILSLGLGYLVPAYVMAGLDESFYTFTGLLLVYLYALSGVYTFLMHMTNSSSVAMTAMIFLVTFFGLITPYSIHPNDLGNWIRWSRSISPMSWVFETLAHKENIDGLTCPRNPVTRDTNIVTQLDCQINSGVELIRYYGFQDSWPIWMPFIVCLGVTVFVGVCSFIFFVLRAKNTSKKIELAF